MIYFYCTSWQFFQMIVKWRISPTTEQIMFTFSIPLFHFYSHIPCGMWLSHNKEWNLYYTDFYSHIPCGMWPSLLNVFSIISYFYSHIPCGMWRTSNLLPDDQYKFLLTHPVWDVTDRWFRAVAGYYISTHTSRVGCDQDLEISLTVNTTNFYSHIPCGMWQGVRRCSGVRQCISTHTSRVGCDLVPIWMVCYR